jgi:succinyl-diaminopimelate desuccinylase
VFDGDGSYPVDNLYARLGAPRPNLAFAGHVDVVPPGDPLAGRRSRSPARSATATYGAGVPPT